MAKKALLIGINYLGTPSELRGCANDVLNMKTMLEQNGFTPDNITLMSDDIHGAINPTKDNMLAQFKYIVEHAAPGDEIVVHYSGHGTYRTDLDGDETDGKDECLCPVDGGEITDDTLAPIFDELVDSAQLTFVADCCHSGTMVDKSKSNIAMITGCKDRQTSADAYIDGQFQGAMTASLLNYVKTNGFNQLSNTLFGNDKDTVYSLLDGLHNWLKRGGYEQRPNVYWQGMYIKTPKPAAAQPAPVQPQPVQPAPQPYFGNPYGGSYYSNPFGGYFGSYGGYSSFPMFFGNFFAPFRGQQPANDPRAVRGHHGAFMPMAPVMPAAAMPIMRHPAAVAPPPLVVLHHAPPPPTLLFGLTPHHHLRRQQHQQAQEARQENTGGPLRRTSPYDPVGMGMRRGY